MEPVRIEERPAGRVVGVKRRVRLAEADWGALWEQGYMPHMAEVDALGSGDACMGCYFGTDEEGVVDFVMGKPAMPGADPTADLVLREMPAARYAVFECGMAEMGQTWGDIYGQWLPASNWDEDRAAACFEEFGPGCMEGTTPVRIYVPVVAQ